MYAYAFVGYFDAETETCLKEVWKALSEKGISQYGVENEGKRPHITLADYNDFNKAGFIEELDKFYEDKNELNINLNILGTFMNSGTLFLAPALSKELISFHNNHHSYFEKFNDDDNSFYLPGRWSPHCTIASRLSKDNMLKAFEYCSDNLRKISGKISQVALIQITLNVKGIAVKDEVIFIKKLK
jgi:2'-5' RNA ligase